MKDREKEKQYFEFDGKTYSGYIVSSTDILPHYHWFMFDDPQVIAKYGDSIAYKVVDGKLIPQYHLTSPDFVAAVQCCVQKFLEAVEVEK